MFKKLVSLLLASMLIISLLPVYTGAAEPENLALGKTTTVNFFPTDIADPATSGVLTDGNKVNISPKNSWYFDEINNASMVLDLGEKKTFNTFVVYEYLNFAITGYKIEVSDDNTSWTEVKVNSEKGVTSGITTTANLYKSNFMFKGVTAQYIRFSVTSQSKTAYIMEVEVFNDIRNLAFAKDVEVSRVSAGCDYKKLTDGDYNALSTASTWEIKAGDYAIIDLGENKSFDCVSTYEFGGQLAQSYTIAVSSDKTSWQQVKVDSDLICVDGTTEYTKNNVEHYYGNHYFDAVNARYVKVTIGAIFDNKASAYLEEIAVYNSSDMPGESPYRPDMDPPVVSEGLPEGYKNENFHIYLCIGQSNMVGRGDFFKDDYQVIDNVYLLNAGTNTKDTADDKWETAQPYPKPGGFDYYGFNRYSSVNMYSNGTMNPAFPFARVLSEYLPEHIGVGIICNAYGGTTIEQWSKGYEATATRPDPGVHGGLYEDAVERTKNALKMGGVLKGILWLQGETCAARGDEYLELLNTMVTNLRNDLGVKAEDVPFIAGQYVQTRPVNNATIARISRFIENSGYASSKGTKTYDAVHYDGASQRLMGIRYAQNILKKVYGIRASEENIANYVFSKPATLPKPFAGNNAVFSGKLAANESLKVINHLGKEEEIKGEYIALASKLAVDPNYTLTNYGFAVSTDGINYSTRVQGLVKTETNASSSAYGVLFHNMKPSTTYYFKPYARYTDASGKAWIVYGDDITKYTTGK